MKAGESRGFGFFNEEVVMKYQDRNLDMGLKLVLQDLNENPYQKFNIAFSLMSVIPSLVFFYVLTNKLFYINIFIGNVGLVLFISIFISFCGFCISYTIIKNILKRIIFYAALAKYSDRQKSTFIATVSHELKNPLLIMKTQILNIQDGLFGLLNEEQKKALELCQNIIERISRLINDLLDLHKIESGVFELERKLCNLVEILERQIKESEIMFNKKRIKLTKEIGAADLSVWANQDKMILIISNLLSNAIKYTPEEGEVAIKIYPFDEFVRLEFFNTGEVIPPDKIEKIFNKFERLNLTKEGTGLGLAITKDIVEMHKGKIWAESRSGEGNRFIVILPRDLRKVKG